MQLATWQMVHLPSCQLHISVNRTAQIYLELHFCVELQTKKALQQQLISRLDSRTLHAVNVLGLLDIITKASNVKPR